MDLNAAKDWKRMVDGRQRRLLVHRKGSTRAFPPHHPLIPVDYQVRNNVLPHSVFAGAPKILVIISVSFIGMYSAVVVD